MDNLIEQLGAHVRVKLGLMCSLIIAGRFSLP